MIKATVGAISGEARARVIPPLPWDESFESYKAGDVPPHWISAIAGRVQVSELDGKKVIEKLPNDTLFKRIRVFMGPSDWSNYTVETDIRINEKRRQMGDAGVIAQRYTLVAFGNNQRLEMNSSGWLIDHVDPIPNKQGSPGLFADAQFGVYFDNYKVTANQ